MQMCYNYFYFFIRGQGYGQGYRFGGGQSYRELPFRKFLLLVIFLVVNLLYIPFLFLFFINNISKFLLLIQMAKLLILRV